MSTLRTTNLQHASAASPAIVLASDGTATAQLSSLNGGALSGARNRIINGDMRIDQRNAGASVTINDAGAYVVDRWAVQEVADGALSVQRDTTAPAGFSNSLKVTVTTADASLAAGQYANIRQPIEGFNVTDLGFGAAGALSVTVSFWVRSSLTGTFGGALSNSAANRSYPFTYTISSANTWEYKTLSIAGDTTGTWLTDNGVGLWLVFGLGVGSDKSGTAGAWSASDLRSATGAVSVIGTLNATFYITGVQLEAGSVATPFERRSYGQELSLCQRYYFKVVSEVSFGYLATAFNANTTRALGFVPFPAKMRTNPTALEQSGTAANYAIQHGVTATTLNAVPSFGSRTTSSFAQVNFDVASGLTAGQGSVCSSATDVTTAYLAWSAEL